MVNNIKSKNGGFLQLIIVIIIALLVMKYFGVTLSGVVNWFATFFSSVFQ